MVRPMSDLWDSGAFLVLIVIGATLCYGITSCGDGHVSDRGAEGQPCYPNLTCDDGFVCYEMAEDEHECRASVRPVKP